MMIWVLVLVFVGLNGDVAAVPLPGHYMTPEECMPAGDTAVSHYTADAKSPVGWDNSKVAGYTCVPQPADAEDKKTQ